MKKYWPIVLLFFVFVAVVGWYLFRPELIFINTPVSESHPMLDQTDKPVNAIMLASGTFTSVAHETNGDASLLKVGDKIFLRLSDFKTSNGPDIRVYLVEAPQGTSVSKAIFEKHYLDLGDMKGNIGDQNYEIPSNVDIRKYSVVSIWCRRFRVNFGEARMKHTKQQG